MEDIAEVLFISPAAKLLGLNLLWGKTNKCQRAGHLSVKLLTAASVMDRYKGNFQLNIC